MSVGAIELPPIHEERLPNGMQLLVAERPGVPLVAVRLFVRAGAALDPPGRFGVAHLVAETSRRGTLRRPAIRIDDQVESLGAELGLGADEDATSFGFSAPVESLAELLDILVDVASKPIFPPAEFERVRRRELAALVHDMDEPSAVADRALPWAVYGDHPYGHPVEGTARHLAAQRRGDATRFHERYFGPASATLVLVGTMGAAKALDLARKKFSRWRSDSEPPPDLPPAEPCSRRVICVDQREVNQTQVRIALPAIPRASPEYFAAITASTTFGGGFTSRLMEAVRVNRGLSYSVRSRFAMSRAAGLFGISSFTKNESVGELVGVILDEVARFCDSGPTSDELVRTQNYLTGLYPLALETHDQIADKLSDLMLYGVSRVEVTQYRARVHAVTVEACRDVARRHFPHERGVIIAVGPARLTAPALERFGPVTVLPARKLA